MSAFDVRVINDEDFQHGFEMRLRDVNSLFSLEKIRECIDKLGGCGHKFVFTKHSTPIGEKQEEFRIMEDLPDGDKVIYINKTIKTEEDDEISNLGRQKCFVYLDEEIVLSQGIELQKRLYWNSRIQDLSEDIKLKRCTKFEAYGIIDVEWTLKRTEILKVKSDKAMQLLQQKNISSGVTSMTRKCESHEKDVANAYEQQRSPNSRLPQHKFGS